jgi:uncharacterized cupin superfamily protein
MTLLKTIKTSNLGEGRHSRLAPERMIEGDPLLTTWEQDFDGSNVKTGIFRAEPGFSISRKGTRYEFCYILEGVVEICEEGGEATVYRAGDVFVVKPGFVGTWRTIETVKKIYVGIDQAA